MKNDGFISQFKLLVVEKFTNNASKKADIRIKNSEILILIISIILGCLQAICRFNPDTVSALLATTSILTGVMFSMAVKFWEKRIVIHEYKDVSQRESIKKQV